MPRPAPCADRLRSPTLDVERDAKLVESQRSFNICSLLEQEVVLRSVLEPTAKRCEHRVPWGKAAGFARTGGHGRNGATLWGDC
jgi:hypothetical protein